MVVGARHALEAHGLERVAIVDFDVHHGNGTQDLVWNDKRICFASTHQMPLYPGTGAREERGAFGQIVNVPLPPGASGGVFRAGMLSRVLPAVEAHAPEMILISAGFDAHEPMLFERMPRPDHDVAEEAEAHGPVSYTHLTLPTILLV